MTRIGDDVKAAMRRLYDEGVPDLRIAAAVGCSRGTVRNWRTASGLPSLGVKGKPSGRKALIVGAAEAKARRMYDAGATDRKIAAELGVSHWTVCAWRKRGGMRPLDRPTWAQRTGMVAALRDPLYARAAACVSHAFSPDIRDEIISEIVLAVLEGSLPEADIEKLARRFASRALGAWASRYGPVSLDEDRDGEGWTRYSATPDPEQEAAFRVVELSILAERLGINARAVLA